MKDIFKIHKTPAVLLVIYLGVLIWSGIRPVDYPVWQVEAATSLLPVAILSVLYFFRIRFSSTAYILAAVLPIMHAIGAHYTFANVPFEWFNNLIHSDRNMYDRVAHYVIGFYAYPLAEYVTRKKLVNVSWITYALAIFAIFTLASVYEIIERQYAVQA
jgi:putative membrane protein